MLVDEIYVVCVFDNVRLMRLDPESNERDRNLLLPSLTDYNSVYTEAF